MKKFKPPSFLTGPRSNSSDTQPPPTKKIKLSDEQNRSEVHQKSIATRTPLLTIKVEQNTTTDVVKHKGHRYFNVVWRKPTTKKHKTWEGDGILIVSGSELKLQDPSGKIISRGRFKEESLTVGDPLTVGGKECEIEGVLDAADYISGKPFLAKTNSPPVDYTLQKQAGRAQFKNPLLAINAIETKSTTVVAPRHSPDAVNALVMTRPKSKEAVVDVVVDPFVSQFLRPHQREGVSFMYDCLMRFKSFEGAGAILADEMGLGKTLQTIALIWTLLKQNCYPSQGPLARKVLIVCPVTLTNNWRREFRKWLGQDRIGVFVVDSKSNVRDFLCGKVYQVMIIGYEKLRMLHETDELKTATFDLIVCDEGESLI